MIGRSAPRAVRSTAAAVTLAGAFVGVSPAATAEVSRKAPYSFQVDREVAIKAAPADVFRLIGEIGRWWNSQHTFSGSAANLSLSLQAGACLCEKWGEGSVEHGRVVQIARDRLVRLEARLGPLIELPVSTSLTFALEPTATGTTLKLRYWVSGDTTLPVGKWADPSDKVFAQQLARLAKLAETGKPE